MTDNLFENLIYESVEKTKPSISVLDKANIEMVAIAASNAVAPKVKKKISLTKLATCITCCLIVLVVGLCIPLFMSDSAQNDGGGVAGGGILIKGIDRIGESVIGKNMLHFDYSGNYLCLTNLVYENTTNYYISEELSNPTMGALEKKTLIVEIMPNTFNNMVEYELLKERTTINGVEIAYQSGQVEPIPHEFAIGNYNYEAWFTFKKGNYTYYGHLLNENAIDINKELNKLVK